MALHTSGPISLSQVQGEFGGSNPISMNEYYRGGAYVPTSISSSTGPLWTTNSYEWSSIGTVQIYWASVIVLAYTDIGTATSWTGGGYTYYKGALMATVVPYLGPTEYQYAVTRASSITVNTSIPASGTISMNQFYGGRKT